MANIILVHGAWHGAWCWYKTMPALEQRGHRVRAVDLPAHGDDMTDIRTVGMTDYVDHVVATTEAMVGDTGAPVYLVGHSMGGRVITPTANRLGSDLVAGLIFLCAMYAAPGKPAPTIERDGELARARQFLDDGKTWTVDPDALKPIFYADCDDADIELARARLVLETTDLQPQPADEEIRHWQSVPKSYITCRDDRAIPLTQQRQMIADSGADHVIDMPTSHSPFFSAPDALAAHIDDLIDRMNAPAL